MHLLGWTLHWCHNEHDGISYYQPYDCLLNRLFWRRSKKTAKLHITGFCEGNSLVTGEFPTQRASKVETASIWWRPFEIPHKISYQYIERCAFYSQVKINELLDLRTCKHFWKVPSTALWHQLKSKFAGNEVSSVYTAWSSDWDNILHMTRAMQNIWGNHNAKSVWNQNNIMIRFESFDWKIISDMVHWNSQPRLVAHNYKEADRW